MAQAPSSRIQVGSEAYTWFMKENGRERANRLDHMSIGLLALFIFCLPQPLFSQQSSRQELFHKNCAGCHGDDARGSAKAPGLAMNQRVAGQSPEQFEYAKVEFFYNQLGIADRCAIAYFNGGHTIHGKETFDFLRKHLR